MRAITVKQPWASCIAAMAARGPELTAPAKGVENRTRPTPWQSAVGERIAIHGGRGWDAAALKHPAFWSLADGSSGGIGPMLHWMVPTFHRSGAVIATAVLADVHTCDGSCSPWADPSQWHLVLEQVLVIDPVPARGALGLWSWQPPPAVEVVA